MKKSTLLYPGLFLSLLFLFITSGFAEEKKLTAVFPTWEPYGYVENDKATGFEIEIFQSVANKMGFRVEFLHQPWKRCLYSMKQNRADVVISALKTKERESFLIYPEEPISISQTAFFTTINKSINFNGSYDTLKNYTIGVTNGFSYGPDFDSCTFLIKDGSTESSAVIKKVLLGRNELGIGNIAVIRTIAKKLNALDKIKFLTPLVHSQNLFAAFSKRKRNEELAKEFSKTLSEFRLSQGYTDILEKYGIK